jgi:hypothetical protein
VSTSYSFVVALTDEAALFRCVATNALGSASTRDALLSIAPSIRTSPASASVAVGATVTLTVIAVGPNLVYNWQRNGVSIGAPSLASYTYTTTTADTAVTTGFQCLVSGLHLQTLFVTVVARLEPTLALAKALRSSHALACRACVLSCRCPTPWALL